MAGQERTTEAPEPSPDSRDASPARLSVIVPFYNEEESVEPLCDRIVEVLENERYGWELILVDDGSEDRTLEFLSHRAAADPKVKVINLRRNFGQTAALAAGFDVAVGEIAVTLDGDLQNDPADIPRLVETLEQGYDLVSGWRRMRRDPWLARRLPSGLANRLIGAISGVPLHDFGCTLKAYRAELVNSLPLYGEMHRFIPAYAALVGARIAEVEVAHHPRSYGASKYGLSRAFKVLLDLLTFKFFMGFGTKPIYLFGGMGLALMIGGVAVGIIVLLQKYLGGIWVHRNPLLFLASFLFGLGSQSVMLGLLAEVLMRVYHESQGKPIYVIGRTLNLSK